ncbi:nitrous oxide reductase family maturation protein NosD [Candidatus Uabimicrobium sp. HlEnr_7]|uniref:right-handed parallel beta-helix repeat-containing protein n=1 Tax=Candidatus Uabimicrobium helgolandensis TaxID=3095367 RepID=UPI00355868A0
MEQKKNNGISWGLVFVILALIALSFWQREQSKKEMNLRILQEVVYTLVREKIYIAAWNYIHAYPITNQQYTQNLKTYIQQQAEQEKDRVWLLLEKNWQIEKQRDNNIAAAKKAQQHQLLTNIKFFQNKINSLPVLLPPKTVSKEIKQTPKEIKQDIPKEIKQDIPKEVIKKVLSKNEQLLQDWQDLLAKEKPEIRGTLKELEKYLRNKRMSLRIKQKQFDIFSLRSKAMVPMFLSLMQSNYRHDYFSLKKAGKVITILTGKKIEFSNIKRIQKLDDLINWWLKDKQKITTDYKSFDRDMKDNCVLAIIDVTTTNNGYYSSFYTKNTKFRGLKSIFDMLNKNSSYRPFVDVKCIPEMIPQFLEHTSSQKWWGLVHIFHNLHKQGNFKNIKDIANDEKQNSMARFICLLALRKNGENFSSEKLFSILEKEKQPINKIFMIMTLRNSNNLKKVLPRLLRKLEQIDYRVRQAICYSLEEYIPTSEQRFVFTPYLPILEKMLIYSLNDNGCLRVLANISSQPSIEIIVSYIEKVYRNSKQKHILSQGLKYLKQATSANWSVGKYYEPNYQIAQQVIQKWRRSEQKIETIDLRQNKVSWLKDLPQGTTFTFDKTKEVHQIKEALSKAQPGDTIELSSGSYFGSFHVPAGVRIVGKSPTETKIEGTIALSSKSSIENICIQSSNVPIKVENANGTLIRNCWIKGISGRSGMSKTAAIEIQRSSDVVLLQNVIYDIGVDSSSDVYAIDMVESSGLIANNIIGRIISKKLSAYAVCVKRCKSIQIYNNTLSHVKSTLNTSYGIYIDHESSALVENNIVNAIYGKESYGIVNQSITTKLQYNVVSEAQLAFVGESHSNYQQNPFFKNDRSGNFTLQPQSSCIGIANMDSVPKIENIVIDKKDFANQLGAFGGYTIFDSKHNSHLQKFKPQKSNINNSHKSIWYGYSGRNLKKNLHNLRDPLKKMRAKMEIKRHKQTIIEVLQMIVDRRGPAEFRGLEKQVEQILNEMKQEMQIGSWSFGKH